MVATGEDEREKENERWDTGKWWLTSMHPSVSLSLFSLINWRLILLYIGTHIIIVVVVVIEEGIFFYYYLLFFKLFFCYYLYN